MEKSLKDLEKENLIKLPNGFGGSNLYDMESGWNRIFLKSTLLAKDNKALKLVCKTSSGSVVSGHIRSENNELLIKLREMLDNMVGKSISDIYHVNIFSYEE